MFLLYLVIFVVFLLMSYLEIDLRFTIIMSLLYFEGGTVAQLAERATPGEEDPGSIHTVAARSLLVGSVSVLYDWLRQNSWSPSSVSCVAARKIVRRSVLGPVHDKA